MAERQFHEDFWRAPEIRGSSDRGFAFVFAAALTVAGLWPRLRGGGVRWWALGLAGFLLMLALARPSVLGPFNRAWTRLGLLLARVVNPVVTAVLFFLVFTPAGILLRLFGKDPLRLRFQGSEPSYWIPRDPPGPAPATMTKQF